MWNGEKMKKITDYKGVYNTMQGNYFYTGANLVTNHNLYFPVRNDGLLQFDGNNYSLVSGLPYGSVLDVFEDSLNNRLLAASTAGMIVLEDYKSPVFVEKKFNESKIYIKTIAQDKFGRYWLGGECMLNIYDGKKFIEFPNEQFDYDHGAISIFMDHRQNMWLGTTSGLYFFNYKEFTKVAKNTLKSQVVSFIEQDTTKLIIGVSIGLAIFDLSAFYENLDENIEILDEARGFLGFDCIRNGILKDSDNNIWVAASERVVKFYPDRLMRDTLNPKVYIHKMKAMGFQSEDVQTCNIFYDKDTVIALPHYLKNVRIDFHSVHFTASEKIKYKYKLIGYDNDWSHTSSERYASYTNLPPGKYSFEVIARNIDDVWSRRPATVSFEIVPALWQTMTFKIGVNILVILVFLTIGYVILNFQRRRRQQREETEKQISELQLKTIRSQMDPHFTFNTLNSISTAIYKENKENAYRYFTKFSKLIRSSLEVSDKISRTLQEEIDFTRNYLDLEKIRFKINFNYLINVDQKVDQQLTIPKMIIHNYAENAVKHGLKHITKNRKLNIDINQFNNHIQIIVEDNGIGRESAAKQNEFSSGKGLAIMKNIYDLYFKLYKIRIKQEIVDLHDEQGNPAGTKVIISIPS